jgi:hypothetical protein
MRKLLVSLLAVAVLGSGAALAQTGTWAGVSVGWPGAALHFGVENVATNLDIRANLGYAYAGAFSFGVDALYGLNLQNDLPALNTYVGGGVGFAFGEGLGIELGLLVGAEYRLAEAGIPQGGVFFEAGPAFAVSPAFLFGFSGRLGFNYHF